MKKQILLLTILSLLVFCSIKSGFSQQNSATHTRGKLWETLYNYGFIGDPGAWDYLHVTGIGFYPGFSGYTFPSDEFTANGFITDANFHNFRSGPWIIAKDGLELTPPDYSAKPKDFLLYHASLTSSDFGVLPTLAKPERTENYIGNPNFNPLLPEEVNYIWFHTATGITVKQRSMSWSYPGYSDFIIYDYTFTNTGKMAIPAINEVKDLEQTLNEVWFSFHSGLQVSTKGMINFHYNSQFLASAAPAGSFGWHPGSGYSDYYAIENETQDGKGLLYYSYDYNGGREPVPWDQYGTKANWRDLLRVKPEWEPELQDPAAFGFLFLYHTPPTGSTNDPFEPDPTHFNIYSDEGQKFQGKTVDFEGFGTRTFSVQQIYDFATHDNLPPNDGRGYFWYTSSFGPYTLAPGDSVRLIVAEIAGMLDLQQVVRGDPDYWFPDSTFAAIHRNAEAARNAVSWGIGATVDGIELAADVPESPPAPNCQAVNVSAGTDTAIISVRWDKLAEDVQLTDGSGGVFYDGATDLSGYRIYRGQDKRGVWDLLIDISSDELLDYWNNELGVYEYMDTDLQFGFEFMYYVEAYNSSPRSWTSANGTVVNNLGELKSADYNRTALIGAKPGPVSIENGWDVFVAPNPYVEGDPNRSFGAPSPDKIEFRNLPEKAVIKIFSLSGDLIRTLKHGPDELGNLFGSIAWDQRSDSGIRVAPGLYIYIIESDSPGSEGKRTTGKLMIVR
jgi:hypothetical protein